MHFKYPFKLNNIQVSGTSQPLMSNQSQTSSNTSNINGYQMVRFSRVFIRISSKQCDINLALYMLSNNELDMNDPFNTNLIKRNFSTSYCRLNSSLQKVCAASLGRTISPQTQSVPTTPNNQSANIRQYHEVTGDIVCPSMIQGIDHLRDPRLNKVSFCEQILGNLFSQFESPYYASNEFEVYFRDCIIFRRSDSKE